MAWTDRYVDATAAGGGTGTSSADPWTLAEAVSNSAAGMRVNIKAGVYEVTSSISTSFAGTHSDSVWWRGYTSTPGDLDDKFLANKITGTDLPQIKSVSGSVVLNNSYFNISGLAFTSSASYPAVNDRRIRSWAKNCRFHHEGTFGNVVSNTNTTNYLRYLSCEFRGYQAEITHASKSLVGGRNGNQFIGCLFHCDTANSAYGVNANASYISIINCVFYNLKSAYTGWFPAYITNNTIIDMSQDAIAISYSAASSLGQIDATANYHIVSNYFANVSGYCIGGDATTQQNGSLLIANNAFYNCPNRLQYTGDAPEFDSVSDSSDSFVDSANSNYELTSSSAAYANGLGRFWSFPTTSYADIGAIQHANPAYVAPPDASATTKIFPFRSWVEGDFQQEGAGADEFVEKHELQALPVFEFSIGTGANRDYNSLTAFFAAFDNTLINIPNSKVVVTCYNDTGADQWISDTSTVTVSCPTNCIDFVLTVDDDSWHKGQHDKGVAVKINSGSGNVMLIGQVNGINFLIERLLLDANNQLNTLNAAVLAVSNGASTAYSPVSPSRLKNLYIRGGDGTPCSARAARGIDSLDRHVLVENCIVENIICNGSYTSYGSVGIKLYYRSKIKNCTVNNIDFTNTGGSNYGIDAGTDATHGLTENCIVTNVNNGDCYNSTLSNTSNLVADDATGTIQSTAAGEFVDAANGDFKLKGTASAAGIVAATNAKVTDITGKLRKAGVAQDAGAFNNVAGYDDSPVFPPDQPTDPIIHPLRSN
jgi:hypothetical protein